MALSVDNKHPEYNAELSKWALVRDCDNGQKAIKSRDTDTALNAKVYLPAPNPTDNSETNKARYSQYLVRANFVNFVNRTIDGLIGEIFSVEAQKEFPTSLEILEDNVDSTGITLEQQARRTTRNVTAYGRNGLLTDYPQVQEGEQVSRADLDTGNIRPTIISYNPFQITNWRTTIIANEEVLSMVVLQETYEEIDEADMFESEIKTQYKVLWLNEEGRYAITIFREVDSTVTGSVTTKTTYEEFSYSEPTKADGSNWDRIPFTFVGSENNDATVDPAPAYDIGVINIAHYRNSADYEENSFVSGQATVGISTTLDHTEFAKANPGGVAMGSRGGVFLGDSGSLTLVQTAPNSLPKEGMDHKEKQMAQLGARIIQSTPRTQTATAAEIDRTSETSVLSTIAKNVSAAYEAALFWAWEFVATDADREKIKYELNDDFEIAAQDPQTIMALVTAWQSGAITQEAMFNDLVRMGKEEGTFEDYRDRLAENPAGLDQGGEL